MKRISCGVVFCFGLFLFGGCSTDGGQKGPSEYEGDESGECIDGADNDRNGLFDCDDPGCAGSSGCNGTDDPSTNDDSDSQNGVGDCDVTEVTTFWTTDEQYGLYKTDGFVFANNRWGGGGGSPTDPGSLTIETGPCLFSYETTHSNDDFDCCSAPYVGIGTIGGYGSEWTADNESLPIRLSEIESLRVNWTFRVPVPLRSTDQYHVYLEIFISDNVDGIRGEGNIAIPLYDHNFYHQEYYGGVYGERRDVNGIPMDVQLEENPYGQGDFWIMTLAPGTYVPNENGLITVNDFDIKSVIDWCVAQGTYNPMHYLTELSLAFEVLQLPGRSLRTEHVSFYVKEQGEEAVISPAWTEFEW